VQSDFRNALEPIVATNSDNSVPSVLAQILFDEQLTPWRMTENYTHKKNQKIKKSNNKKILPLHSLGWS
jgi:hypothetical protein